MDFSPFNFIIAAVVTIISLTVHELAHARTALAFGDPTAKYMGRVTLNPLAHLDPLGTIAMLMSSLAGIGFGWAKPVPVNPANLHPPRLGEAMVSLAGPMANIFLAIAAGLAIRAMIHFQVFVTEASNMHYVENLWLFLPRLMYCNLGLAVFNLIPLFPLDGHHIQRELLPAHRQVDYMQWQMQYGQFILLGLLFVPPILQRALNLPYSINPLTYLMQYTVVPAGDFLMGLN